MATKPRKGWLVAVGTRVIPCNSADHAEQLGAHYARCGKSASILFDGIWWCEGGHRSRSFVRPLVEREHAAAAAA